MENEHGLDAAYFKKNLDMLSRDVNNYTPPEMYRALTRLASVAATTPNKKSPIGASQTGTKTHKEHKDTKNSELRHG